MKNIKWIVKFNINFYKNLPWDDTQCVVVNKLKDRINCQIIHDTHFQMWANYSSDRFLYYNGDDNTSDSADYASVKTGYGWMDFVSLKEIKMIKIKQIYNKV